MVSALAVHIAVNAYSIRSDHPSMPSFAGARPEPPRNAGPRGRAHRRATPPSQPSQRVVVSPPAQLSRPLPPFISAVLVASAESSRSLPLPPSIDTVSLF